MFTGFTRSWDSDAQVASGGAEYKEVRWRAREGRGKARPILVYGRGRDGSKSCDAAEEGMSASAP